LPRELFLAAWRKAESQAEEDRLRRGMRAAGVAEGAAGEASGRVGAVE
jgi:hypothetical protein